MRKTFEKLPALVQDLLVDLSATFLAAIGVYNFASAAGFAPGGVSGVGIILNFLGLKLFAVDIPIGFWNLALNVPIIIYSWRYVGKNYLLRTLRTVITMSLMMDLVVPHLGTYQGDPFLAAIFGGVFMGAGLAIAFGNGTCTGGLDLVIMSIKVMRPHMSFGQITLITDAIVIISGGLVFGKIDSVLYGFILVYVMTKVLDTITTGANSGKLAMIITEDGDGLGEVIEQKIQRGATILGGKGAYSGRDKHIVLCALSRRQLPDLRAVVKEFDQQAFLIVLEYKDVFGTGFQPH